LKKMSFNHRQLPLIALVIGCILLLGVLLSFKFVCAMISVALIVWGLWSLK